MSVSADRTAVITGAGSGIGRALALELSRRSIRVVAVGRRAESLKETSDSAPNQIRPVVADVTSPADRRRISGAIQSANVGYLVHLAGLMKIARLMDLSPQEWESSFATLVHARLYLTQQLLPNLGRGSRILFVGSQSALKARAGAAAYCAPYAASSMLVRCLQHELAPRGVEVNQAIPGAVNTDLLQQSIHSDPAVFPDAAAYQRLGEEGRWVRAEAAARFFAWLLTEASKTEFAQTDLNIADSSHHPQWTNEMQIFHGPKSC